MTTTAHISQILLDTITHISAVPERVRWTASTVDMGVPDGTSVTRLVVCR
jgi:hypothetical protein